MAVNEPMPLGPKIEFACPHCAKGFSITLGMLGEGGAEIPPMTAEWRAQRWREQCPEAVRKFLDECEGAGILASFWTAFNHVPLASRPKNAYRFLFLVVGRMRPWKLAETTRGQIRSAMGTKTQLTVYRYEQMCVLVSDGSLKGFLPVAPILEVEKTFGERHGEVADPKQARVDFSGEWIKTRFGYVTSPVMFEEFRRRTLGAWDTVTGVREA